MFTEIQFKVDCMTIIYNKSKQFVLEKGLLIIKPTFHKIVGESGHTNEISFYKVSNNSQRTLVWHGFNASSKNKTKKIGS